MLTGCRASGGAMQQALQLRTELLQAGGCRYAADVSVSYDDVRFDFTLDCVCGADGAARMTIRAPQTLAGIAAELEGSSARVKFEDTAVAFGLMADGNLAPMQLPQLFVQALCADYISSAGQEGDAVRVTYLHGYDDDELTVDVWLSGALMPDYAEVSYQGQMLAAMTITDFTPGDPANLE